MKQRRSTFMLVKTWLGLESTSVVAHVYKHMSKPAARRQTPILRMLFHSKLTLMDFCVSIDIL